MSKLRLDLDELAVESFDTGTELELRGTVRAHGEGEGVPFMADCTAVDSCYCRTAYAVCGTGPATIYSCQPTTPRCF
ncbi:MAG: hypothetical protein JWM27_1022 [Gemmatimonadetes bacterium]|nr:hypothetical protein [Gemmatimonadota bacterium]